MYSRKLSEISPIPKAAIVPGSRKRKTTGSEIITSSPFKNELVIKQQQNKRPRKQKPANQKPVKKSQQSLDVLDVEREQNKVATKKSKKLPQHATPKRMASAVRITEDIVANDPAARNVKDSTLDTTKRATNEEKCNRPKRMRKQLFSLAEAMHAIEANSDSDVE